MDIKANKRKIWDMWENILIFLCSIIAIILWKSDCVEAAFIALLILLAIFIEELIRMKRYNNFLEHGEVVVGQVCEHIEYALWIYIKVMYIDPETEKRYTYSTVTMVLYAYNLARLLESKPEMYVVIDKYKKGKGSILVEEYLKEMDWR